MTSMWKRTAALAVLGIAVAGWGCESGTEPVPQAGLEAESSVSSLLDGSDDGSTLDFLERSSSLLVEQIVTTLATPEDGGELELLGHELVIPAGAVEKATYFVMIVLPGNAVQVELFAFDAQTGLDVGDAGFLTPVQLALSYADVSGIKDPSQLVIVHVPHDGEPEPLATRVDEEAQKAHAELWHFSRYALCRN